MHSLNGRPEEDANELGVSAALVVSEAGGGVRVDLDFVARNQLQKNILADHCFSLKSILFHGRNYKMLNVQKTK